jgi:hypothetical protein
MADIKENKFGSWMIRYAVHLGLAAVLLAAYSAQILGLPELPFAFYAAMWLGTQVFYSVSAILPLFRSKTSSKSKLYFLWMTSSALLLALGLAWFWFDEKIYIIRIMSAGSILCWPFLLLVAAYYPFRTQVTRFYPRLALLKPIVVGGVWAWWVTVVPVLFTHASGVHSNIDSEGVWNLFLYQCVLLSWVSAISDFRDVVEDRKQAFPTWAMLAHSGSVKILAAGCFLTLGAWICTRFMSDGILQRSQACLLFVPYATAAICTAALQKKRNPWFFVWAVDGILFLTALCFYSISWMD